MKRISKFFLTMVLVVASAAMALAANGPADAVKGTVKDANGAPVAGAVVTDEDMKAFATTDEDLRSYDKR